MTGYDTIVMQRGTISILIIKRSIRYNIQNRRSRKKNWRAPSQAFFFVQIKNENEVLTKVNLTVKRNPFTDGELIKSFLLVAAEEIWSHKNNLFRHISQREELGTPVNTLRRNYNKRTNKFKWFSLALNDITDTAPKLLIIPRINRVWGYWE